MLTLSPEFVNELGLPVKHNVLLVLNGFFLYTKFNINIYLLISFKNLYRSSLDLDVLVTIDKNSAFESHSESE